MKKHILKILLCLLFVLLPMVGTTRAYFSSQVTVSNNTVTTGCWVVPDAPNLSLPSDDTYSNASGIEFSWTPSTSSCPIAQISYQFEAFDNPSLTGSPVYASLWIPDLNFDVASISEGTYYWHVRVKDQFGNENLSLVRKLVVDRTAPVISSVEHLIASPNESNDKQATITWTTSELSTSNVEWRIGSGSWNLLTLDTTPDSTFHFRDITGLLSGAHYSFRVKSADLSGNEGISGIYAFETDGQRPGLGPWSDIVINEFLPNPTGSDNAPTPGGEWVELYNKGTTVVDLSGWFLTDADFSHKLHIASGTTIGPNEFSVIYRNGASGFDLRNSFPGDVVILYDALSHVIDFHGYTSLLGDEVLENKSFARFPDGSSIWFDPIPTPGEPNQLEPEVEPELEPEPSSSPEPTPQPTPTATVDEVEPSPTPELSPTPTVEPTIEPPAEPEPTLEPTPEPTPGPTPEVSPTPLPEPIVEPEPTPDL